MPEEFVEGMLLEDSLEECDSALKKAGSICAGLTRAGNSWPSRLVVGASKVSQRRIHNASMGSANAVTVSASL